MSMLAIIQELDTLCTANLVPTSVDKVYQGINDEDRQVLTHDNPYLILDDGGEPKIDTVVMGQQVKQYDVIFKLVVRRMKIEDALADLLTAWIALEDLIFLPENRFIERANVRVSEELERFPDVEASLMEVGGDNAPCWRFRRSVVPYRLGFCRGGFHTP